MRTPQEATSITPLTLNSTAAKYSATSPSNLTTRQAADYLGLKEATLEQWRWAGRGPRFIKLGRACRYRITDLDDYMNSRVFSSTTEAQAAEV